jgi:DNA repair protein RadD
VASPSDLWPHQIRGIELAREAMRLYRRVVLQIPTGGGKTRLGSSVAAMSLAKGRRVMWTAHRTELVGQAFDTLDAAGLSPGCIAAQCDRPARPGPLQVASLQTVLAREADAPDLIVADECHHLGEGAEHWASLLKRYPLARVLGLTATPERGDGTGLAPLFEFLIQVVSVRELTTSGHLVACEVDRPDRYLRERGDTGNKLAQDPVKRYLEIGEGRQAILFASTVEEAQEYAQRLTDAGVTSRCVHAKTPADERVAMLDGYRRGTVRVLTNVYVLTEGTDLPMCSCIILASGCGTAGNYLQKVGRGLRVAGGKRDCLLIDLPGVSHLHGMPEDERLWRLTGKACVVSGQTCKVCSKPIEGYPCPTCGYAPEPEDGTQSSTEVLDVPMAKFARKIAEGPTQRWETLLRKLHQANMKGHKPTSVRHWWKAVYGEELSPTWYRAALAGLNGAGRVDKPPC